MTDAALQGSPLVAATSAGIGVNVVGRQVEATEQIGRDIDLHAFDVTFVTIFVQGVALQFLRLVIGHLGKFGLQHGQ